MKFVLLTVRSLSLAEDLELLPQLLEIIVSVFTIYYLQLLFHTSTK